MLKNKKITIIGTGNMGEALLSGLISSGSSHPKNIICTDIREDKLKSMEEKYGVATTADNIKAVEASEIIIYAVKPQIIASVLRETASCLDMSKLIISIAAGVPLAAIESCLNKELRLIRVMPNIAAFVKESASVIAAGGKATEEDIKLSLAIFDSMGKSIFLKENILMDAITGLSGSGPAYIFLIVESMADAGVKMGLSREDALFLSSQTVLGAAKLLIETKEHPGRLKDMVTSPGGTAIAGIHTLEKGGLRTTLINAVEVATKRSKELGEIVIKNFSNEQ
ncbi:MAG: pyrroline-5-carboxylate reductase [Deltaproteobacteria bacterium]|nr:pyrroline-5-carboxylate reductase [Deltaproteobacteria bacterium]MBW2620696.1 pyrroline-5-carboxylate reductase [Deltaproteobacteria bacterium]MBW2641796.1 pyrroline-5-carboxylate reductase [Deltaproteobacteria bacterium]